MDDKSKLIREFASSLKGKGRRPATIESYQRDAIDFLEFLENIAIPVELVDTDTLCEFIKNLEQKERHNSIRRKIIGVRQFFRFLADTSQEYDSPLDNYPIPKRDETLPEDMSDNDIEEIITILLSQKGTLKARRDLAIFYLLAFEGLKATELINLKWESFIFSRSQSSLQVLGIRGRTIALGNETAQAIKDYQKHLARLSTDVSDYIFISFKGRDTLTIAPKISRHGLKFLIYELGDVSGIPHMNTELLRHYAIRYQLTLGKSPAEVMAHFGLKRLGNIAKHVHRRGASSENTTSI